MKVVRTSDDFTLVVVRTDDDFSVALPDNITRTRICTHLFPRWPCSSSVDSLLR